MSAEIKEILTNPEVLAVHKDPLAKMALRIDVGGGVEEAHASRPCASNFSVYGKDLSDGSSAVMVLNRGAANATYSLYFEDVGDSLHSAYATRDLWRHINLTASRLSLPTLTHGGRAAYTSGVGGTEGMGGAGLVSTAAGLQLNVPAHGVRVLRMWPLAPPPPLAPCPTGYVPHPPGLWANASPSSGQPQDGANTTTAACARKCDLVQGCAGFEVYEPAPRACYIFVGELEKPFTSNPDCFACVRKAPV